MSAVQIDASKILSTLPKDFFGSPLRKLASLAIKNLGFPAPVMKVKAQAVKLILYQKGDCQSCPFDQDAKPGNTLKLFAISIGGIHFISFDFLQATQLAHCFCKFPLRMVIKAAFSS